MVWWGLLCEPGPTMQNSWGLAHHLFAGGCANGLAWSSRQLEASPTHLQPLAWLHEAAHKEAANIPSDTYRKQEEL